MQTHPSTRKRYASQAVITGGLRGIIQGLFGSGSPQSGLVEQQQIVRGALYHYHQGDLFLPGPAAMVLDPAYDTPIYTQWGNGWLNSVPNAFAPLSGGPPYASNPITKIFGTAGPSAGQIVFQPLTVRQMPTT